MVSDKRVKLDCVKSVKCFNLKRVKQCYKDVKKQEKKNPTDRTLHRGCECKQTITFFLPNQ